MTCPRCGQQLPPASLKRCPQCGQPLYAPANQPSRITRLAPTSGELAPRGRTLDEEEGEEAWPDLSIPLLGDPGPRRRSWSTTFPLSRPPTWLIMPPRSEGSRRLVGVILVAALILIAISGGTLLLVHNLHDSTASAPPGRPNTAQGLNNLNATSTPSVASATSVPTNTTGLPASTPAAPIPTTPPTSVATPTSVSTPQLVTIFSDPLTSNTKGWPVQNGCAFGSSGYSVSGGAQCVAPVTAQDTVNISVQMTNTSLNFAGAGIGFRIPTGQSQQQYTFDIYSEGFCMATDVVTNTTLFNNLACSAVVQGDNAVNTLAINQSGAHMDFYVNGTLVGSANDATLSGGGVALEVHKHGPTVVFTNFILTTLK
jgi:hypothetical protein